MNFENLEFLTKVAGKHGLKEAKHTYMQLQSLGFFTWKVRVKKKKSLLQKTSREIVSLGDSQVYVMATM